MSIRFNGNVANYLARTTSPPDYNANYTIMAWIKIVVDLNATTSFLSLSTGTALNFDRAKFDSDGTTIGVSARNGATVVNSNGTNLTIETWRHVTMRRAGAADLKLFLDAVQDAFSNTDVTGRTANDNLNIGRVHVNNLTIEPFDGEMGYLRIWATDLTEAEIAVERLAATAVKTASLYGDYPLVNAATAGDDISGNDNHLTVNGTITTGASEPPLVTGPSLFRGRAFSFFDDEEVNRFEFWPAVGGAVDLEVQDASHAHTADSLTLTQAHNLEIQSATHAHTAENVILTQTHSLAVQDSLHSHTADNAALAQVHSLSVQDSTHGHAAESATLTQVHNLAVQGASHAHNADNVIITQAHSLSVDSASHEHSAENVLLSQSHALTVQSSDHAHSAANISLIQAHELSVQNTLHAHTADNIEVDQAIPLVVQDAVHGHVVDSPTLGQVHELALDDVVHAHLATSVVLTQAHNLIVAAGSHAHTAGNVVVTSAEEIVTPSRRTFIVELARRTTIAPEQDRMYVVHKRDRQVKV